MDDRTNPAAAAGFVFDHSLWRDLPELRVEARPDVAPSPELVALNEPLARDLGLDVAMLHAQGAEWFSGAELPPGARPLALAYSGHQFGGFSPVLGDGRAHLLGEFVVQEGAPMAGQRLDLQLKGSGRTAFSRGGDGKAGLGPMLREYLISEAMHALGIATTRALAVTTTGETIWRDAGLRPGPQPGAVVARVAASHIRVGSFQFHASRGERAALEALARHVIARHDPDLADLPAPWLALFDRVAARQVELIAAWMSVGFIHGVMNTDNVALSGETIDYGPCAFMEGYAPGTVFSSIDRQGRYSWGNQPRILAWNLAKFAEALLVLHGPDQGDIERAVTLYNARLSEIAGQYQSAWMRRMAAKLGLERLSEAEVTPLVDDLLRLLSGADWTLFFHDLAGAADPVAAEPLRARITDLAAFDTWLARWRALGPDVGAMARVNPAVIARNHLVEAALAAAEVGDLQPFDALLAALRQPFHADPAFMAPAPEDAGAHVTFCGT